QRKPGNDCRVRFNCSRLMRPWYPPLQTAQGGAPSVVVNPSTERAGHPPKGDSRASVIDRMGKPNYHEGKCGVIHFPDKNCAVEYVYSHPFAPFVPEYYVPAYYVVSFSPEDRVIDAESGTRLKGCN